VSGVAGGVTDRGGLIRTADRRVPTAVLTQAELRPGRDSLVSSDR
jgi:hypothetical protein